MEVLARKARGFLMGGSIIARMSDLGLLGEEACFFIESVLAGVLRSKTLVGFDLILELVNSPQIEQLNIVTPNHDTLVERFLAENGIDFVDGFGKPDGDVRWYDDYTYDIDQARIRLVKLHGSINWYSFVVDGRQRPVVFLGDNVEQIRNGNGTELKLGYRMPSILSCYFTPPPRRRTFGEFILLAPASVVPGG
jgi:hypothetical protein